MWVADFMMIQMEVDWSSLRNLFPHHTANLSEKQATKHSPAPVAG